MLTSAFWHNFGRKHSKAFFVILLLLWFVIRQIKCFVVLLLINAWNLPAYFKVISLVNAMIAILFDLRAIKMSPLFQHIWEFYGTAYFCTCWIAFTLSNIFLFFCLKFKLFSYVGFSIGCHCCQVPINA